MNVKYHSNPVHKLSAAEIIYRRIHELSDQIRQIVDPAYLDTIGRRGQRLTGGSAQHAVSGRTIDDLAREAEAANGV
jgi:hypothetical protein